eukprot:sb/3469973/
MLGISGHLSNISTSIDEYNSLMNDIEDNVWTISNQSAAIIPSSKLKEKFGEVFAELERDKMPDFKPDLHQFIFLNLTREMVTAILGGVTMLFCGVLLTAVFYLYVIGRLCCLGAFYFGVVAVQRSMLGISGHLSNISTSIDEYNSLMNDIEDNVWTISNQSAAIIPSSKLKEKFGEVFAELERDKMPDFKPDLHQFIFLNLTREMVNFARHSYYI